MNLLVGCPVYERGWVLPQWFDHLAEWTQHVSVSFVFAYTPGNDDTLEIIREKTHKVDALWHYITVTDGTHSTERNWGSKDRLVTLAYLRNRLLTEVRDIEPDYYLSLDSDILVPPWEQSSLLFEGLLQFDAVAPLVHLGGGDISNAFYQTARNHRRRVTRQQFYDTPQPVDIICASKLMAPRLFNDERVHYGYHGAGEDIYWSAQATSYGYGLGLDTRIRTTHIMKPEQLDKEDIRLGW